MKSEQIDQLAAALSAAQGEMPTAKFNAVNPFLKNKYADLGSVIEAGRHVLPKHGLAVTQLVSGGAQFDQPGAIEVETILMHKSGQWVSSTISLPVGEERGKSQAQVAGSIISYLRRYAYASILGIYAEEDTDGNQPEPKQTRKPEPAPAPAPDVEYPAELVVVTNSKGTPYVELDSDALSKMQIGIRKALADVGMSDDDKARYAAKNDAINQILALRQGK
jgi:hypothetical protein